MAKKAIDISRLQKMTQRGRRRSDEKEAKERLTEDEKSDKEAKKLSNKIISGLPARIRREAMSGHDSLDVLLPSIYPLDQKVGRNVSSWCFANGLSVTTKKVRFSDDSGLEEVLVISWRKEK